MNIIQAMKDRHLFRPFVDEDLTSWANWIAALKCVYGIDSLKRSERRVIRQCTGRRKVPTEGFDTALFLTGRRSGKSKTAAVIGAYEAVLSGREKRLSPGEKGLVVVVAPTKKQAGIVKSYLRAIFDTPLLQNEITGETVEGFQLRNQVEIQILAGDWRTIRGFTLLAAIVDEVCFFGYDAECRVKSDTELIRAIKPSLATVGGKLIGISSPYAKKGWSYRQYKNHWGNDEGRTLVWNCPSRTMNPNLPEGVVQEALAEDRQAALSEYMGEFREDVAEFVPRSLVESLVVKGRKELIALSGHNYRAFVDISGGRKDDATLAIGHRKDRTVILDCVRRYKPPFNPYLVIQKMVEELHRYRINRVTGDNYSAEFVAKAFESAGIRYTKSDKPKSQLYIEFLPRLCSGEIELLDNEVAVDQISNLERRTRPGGRDIIDHPRDGKDDVANAIAGVADVATGKRIRIGGLGYGKEMQCQLF